MMKSILIFLLGCLVPSLLWSQEQSNRYTYAEDRQFIKESDVYGYTFVPAEGKMSTAHYPDPIKPGLVTFTIRPAEVTILERVQFTPAGISGTPTNDKAYSLRIARIDKTSYGYELRLVDIKNRDMQGHLKLYIDAISQIDMIKYRPSMADPEHTYMLKRTPKQQNTQDGKFFTHKEDFDARTLDEFWGKTLYPFMELQKQSSLDQRKIKRIFASDNIDIKFEERTVTKGKKEKVVQYITFNSRGGDTKTLMVKKVKEVQHQDRDGNRKLLELQVKDELRQDEFYILMHRGVKTMLRAIELQNAKTRESVFYYEMRKGKRIIE